MRLFKNFCKRCKRLLHLHCEPKKHTKMFLSYLPQNHVDSDKICILVYIVLNEFTIQQFKRFPAHLNNVATLPCET